MRKSSKTRSDNSASSSIAAERLADYRGNSGSSAACGSSSCNAVFGPASPNVSPSTPDTDNLSGTSPASTTNTCSSLLNKMSVSEDCYTGEFHASNEVEQAEATSKEAGKVCCLVNRVIISMPFCLYAG